MHFNSQSEGSDCVDINMLMQGIETVPDLSSEHFDLTTLNS